MLASDQEKVLNDHDLRFLSEQYTNARHADALSLGVLAICATVGGLAVNSIQVPTIAEFHSLSLYDMTALIDRRILIKITVPALIIIALSTIVGSYLDSLAQSARDNATIIYERLEARANLERGQFARIHMKSLGPDRSGWCLIDLPNLVFYFGPVVALLFAITELTNLALPMIVVLKDGVQ